MRSVRRLVVVLVVLAGVALVLDRVGVWLANRVVADQVAEELAAHQVESAPPEVGVSGFPFLSQLVTGRYGSVDVILRDVGRDGLRLPIVRLTATGVDAPLGAVLDGSGPIHAERVTGQAVIGYGSVVELAGREGLQLVGGVEGTLRMRLPVEVVGVPVVLVGRAEVTVAGAGLLIELVEFDVEAPVDLPAGADPLIERAARSLSLRVALPPLPYGLAVDTVRVEPAGIVVTVSANDVPLAG